MKKQPLTPSVSHTFTIRLSYPNRVGMFAKVVGTIGKHGGDLGAVDIVAPDVTCQASGAASAPAMAMTSAAPRPRDRHSATVSAASA